MKQLALLVLALLMSSAAFAQTFPPPDPVPAGFCNSDTNVDASGNECFNFEIEAGDPLSRYEIYEGSYYQYFMAQIDHTPHAEGNPTIWPGLYGGYYGVLTIQPPNGAFGSDFANPEDPFLTRNLLQLCGGPCDQADGGPGYINREYNNTQNPFGTSSWTMDDVYSVPDASCVGYRGAKNYSVLTKTITFTNWYDANYNGYPGGQADYPYNWSGSVVITFNGTPRHSCGRGGCYCSEIYTSQKSWGEASAALDPIQ